MLPSLPKINKRSEADFGLKFRDFLLKTHKQTGIFELKVAKNNRLPFSAVLPHQIASLEQARHSTLVFKIPDMGQSNPADYISYHRSPAWIVIRYDTHFCMITIDNFNAERFLSNKSKTKSLSWERAREIATYVI